LPLRFMHICIIDYNRRSSDTLWQTLVALDSCQAAPNCRVSI